MARKHKCPPVGAPAWVLTYGDMMSLLLCFFVLLASLANFDKQDKMFMAAMESIAKTFGSPGQSGYFSDDTIDFKSLMIQLQSPAIPSLAKNYGHSDEAGIDGRYYRVRKIRDGMELTIGGPIAFQPFSAKLEPEAQAILDKLVSQITGKTNKLEIRGHTTDEPLPPDSPFHDHLDLGYARAHAVADYLMARHIDPRAIRVSTAGAYEPIRNHAYSDSRRANNRRVEIIVTQSLITDYLPKSATGATPELTAIDPGDESP